MNGNHRPCSLCGADAGWMCRQLVLGKHDVDYFLCPRCELLQTERAYWLAEAYADAISELDTGAIARNETCARLVELVALVADIDANAPCLDFGGGHGVLVRMLRDVGLDFRWSDRHAENLYARGFEGRIAAHHALVTAFEVFEHLADVGAELDALFAPRPDLVLVGTVLHHGHQPGWWYYMLESGQHVCFYAGRTMAWIGERYGYDEMIGAEYTLFVRHGIGLGRTRRFALRQLMQRPAPMLAVATAIPEALRRRLRRYRSRVQSDHEAMRARVRS